MRSEYRRASRSSIRLLTTAIEKAQKKIEGNNFGIRKNLLEYDQVNNEQREIIYKERRKVLTGTTCVMLSLRWFRSRLRSMSKDVFPRKLTELTGIL